MLLEINKDKFTKNSKQHDHSQHIPGGQEEENTELFQASLSLTSFSSQVELYQVLSYDTQQLQPAHKTLNSKHVTITRKNIFKINGERLPLLMHQAKPLPAQALKPFPLYQAKPKS